MELSVIIVTYNSLGSLERCLSSLLKHLGRMEFEIIVVDNASRYPDYLQAVTSPRIRVIRNASNLGFSRANNIGFRQSRGKFVLLLNPDVELIGNPLPRLLTALTADRNIGVIGPLLKDEDGNPQVRGYYLRFPDIFQLLATRTVLTRWKALARRLESRCHSRLPTQGLAFVDQIPGAFLLFPRDMIASDSVLCEDYFIWMEDVDFCKRIHRSGMRVAVLCNESVRHSGGTSFASWPDLRKQMVSTESYLTYLRNHHSATFYATAAAILTSSACTGLALLCLSAIIKPRRPPVELFRLEVGTLRVVFRHVLRGALPGKAPVAKPPPPEFRMPGLEDGPRP